MSTQTGGILSAYLLQEVILELNIELWGSTTPLGVGYGISLIRRKGFPDSSVGKEFTCNAGDLNLIPELGRSPGEGIGYPLRCSWASLVAQLVKNPPVMREAWVWSLGWEDLLEKGRSIYSSILAWRIPWTEEPGGLQSMGSQRVRHNWSDLACTHALSINWTSLVAQLVKNPPVMREIWVQSLVWEDPLEKGTATHSSILAWRSPCGCKETDMTEQLSLRFFLLRGLYP